MSDLSTKALSLPTLIIAPFVLLIALAVGVTGYFSFYKGQQAVDQVATQLHAEITHQIQGHLQKHLDTPILINQINANAVRQGLLDPHDQTLMERYLWQQIKLFGNVSSIYFGNTRGGLVDAGREGDETLYVIVTDDFVNGPFKKYATDALGRREKLVLSVPNFDARTRPWYQRAMTSGEPVWSDIYILFSGHDMAIAASQPLYDDNDQFLGVLSTDLFLSQFQDYLQNLQIADSGKAFILERSGLLVATSLSDQRTIVDGDDGSKQRVSALNSGDPLIDAGMQQLLSRFTKLKSIDTSHNFQFTHDGHRYFAQIAPFNTPQGIDWLSLVLIPEGDFLQQIRNNALTTLAVVIITLIIAIGSVVVGTRWLTQPILRLNRAAQALSAGEPPKSLPNSRIREINQLTQSFDRMAKGLHSTLEELTSEVTERKRAQSALNDEHQRLQNIIEGTQVGTWEWNLQNSEVEFDERWAEMIGYTLQEIQPTSVETWVNLMHPYDLKRSNVILKQHFSGERDHYECEIRLRHKAGHWVWVNVRGKLVSYTEDGAPLLMAGTHTDISEKKRIEENLRLSASVFENTAEGVVITDPDGRIIDINRAFTEITGYSRNEVMGRNPGLLKSGRHQDAFYQEMWIKLTEIGQWRGEIWNRRRDGSIYPEWLTISKVTGDDDQLTHYVGVFSDISQIKQSQDQLEHMAQHDPLTGLPNRLLLNDRLDTAIRHAERSQTSLAVMFLDLDHFKHINDSLGHTIGDQLLQTVAAALEGALRREDTVCRIGGDEFVLLLNKINDPESAAITAEKLVALFDQPFILAEHSIRITTSLGICLYPRDGTELDTLLRNADAAMYRAKEAGRNCYHFYTEELTQRAMERVQLENRLREAVERNELFLMYQPQFDLRDERIIGLEALLRWKHPEQGMISPARFIPLAEDSGLIHPIGEWVLRKACEQGVAWLEDGMEYGRISVNIAGPQIQRGQLPKIVASILDETGLPPDRLELEVTESFIMQQADSAIDQLHALRDLGIALSIDDFGTGYSSLSYLKQLPIHRLKIDQSFVHDIPSDPNDMAITAAVIAMGHNLDLSVIAEGVETEEQAQFLKSHDCHEVQGYLYSRPLLAEGIKDLLPTAASVV